MANKMSSELEAQLSDIGLDVPIPEFKGADVLSRPLDIIHCYLASIVYDIFQVAADDAFASIQLPSTPDDVSGDAVIILPKLCRSSGQDLKAVIESLLSKFPDSPLFGPPILDGKQARVFCHSEALSRIILAFIEEKGPAYALSRDRDPEHKPKVIVEFSSPNIVAPLNGKHVRSTLLGCQIANMYESQGWDVVRMNYLGDWGKPIGLLGAGFEKLGSNELLEQDIIGHLRDVFKQISDLFAPELAASRKARDDKEAREVSGDSAEIESKGIFAERNAYFARLEAGEANAIQFWERFRGACIEEYKRFYASLGIRFDEYTGESEVTPTTMSEFEAMLKSKGICEESEGSLVIHLEAHGSKHGTAIIRDRSGSSTYLLRELAAVLDRDRHHHFDKMVYVVAADQHSTHFHRVSKILELAGHEELAKKLLHVSFNETIHFPRVDAAEMTFEETRSHFIEGSSIKLGCSVEEATLSSRWPDTGSGALFAHCASIKRTAEWKVDFEQLKSSERNGGLYLQRWLDNLNSALVETLEEETGDIAQDDNDILDDEDYSVLLRWLTHYPECMQQALRIHEPAVLETLLSNISVQLSECFEGVDKLNVGGRNHRRILVASQHVLSAAMQVLNVIRPPCRDSGVFF